MKHNYARSFDNICSLMLFCYTEV